MQQYQRIGLIFSATFFLALPASADTLFGVYGGAGTWRQELHGEIASGPIGIDVPRHRTSVAVRPERSTELHGSVFVG